MKSIKCVLAWLLSAGCSGDDSETDSQPLEAPSNIDQAWLIRSQTCDGAPVSPDDDFSYYRFDDSHVVRVETFSNEEASICLIGYVYDEVVSEENPGTSSFERLATLTAAGTKTTCWRKEGGEAVEPPTSDEVGTFGPEIVAMEMVVTAEGVTLNLGDAPGCNGTLNVALEPGESPI